VSRPGYEPHSVAWLLVASLAIAGCATALPPPRLAPAALSSPPAPAPAITEAPEATPDLTAPARPAFVAKVPELAHFHEALFGLETRSRRDHARIAWLGDSHGQADFWSGRVRRDLQKRFGDGGPGYVALGYKNYRHDRVAIEIGGKWRMRPKQPASAKPVGDGVYGLAGLLMGGYSGGPRVALTYDAPASTRLRFDVCVKTRAAGDGFSIEAPGGDSLTLTPPADNVGKLLTFTLTGQGAGPLVVKTIGGSPDYCGAVIETDPASRPGVVLDQLGFNGARYGTPLAWDEATWSKELARRAPDLVILEYGGNEAGDASPAYEKIGAQVEELAARVRRVRPNADCLVIAPTDRADAEDRVPLVVASVKAAAARAKCAFFDAYALSGGRGSMAARREETKPRAQKDGVHMTIRGYEEMGALLAAALVEAYEGPRATAKSDLAAPDTPVPSSGTRKTPQAPEAITLGGRWIGEDVAW